MYFVMDRTVYIAPAGFWSSIQSWSLEHAEPSNLNLPIQVESKCLCKSCNGFLKNETFEVAFRGRCQYLEDLLKSSNS